MGKKRKEKVENQQVGDADSFISRIGDGEFQPFTVREFTPPRTYSDDPGGYYDRCRDEAAHWRSELERAIREEAWEHVIAGLQARLERAEYVGD